MQAPVPATRSVAPPPELRLVPAEPATPPPTLLPLADAVTPPKVMLPPPTDAVSLRARYGAPDFIRRESESELWRYDGANCAAFFFLYREGGDLKLRYSETMPRGMGMMAADPACVESLSAHPGATS